MDEVKFPYNEKIAEVEDIISHLKADDVEDVEKMLSDVQKATVLLNDCRKHLTDLKGRLDDIVAADE